MLAANVTMSPSVVTLCMLQPYAVTLPSRLMSPPSRFALRRDIGESADMITVTA